jgi:hypothetical protein
MAFLPKENGTHWSFEDMSADVLRRGAITSGEKRTGGNWYREGTDAAHESVRQDHRQRGDLLAYCLLETNRVGLAPAHCGGRVGGAVSSVGEHRDRGLVGVSGDELL